ncbi:hypothetical protein HanHA300_Chr02g0046801 [Helianthus annuus]|nr:hypothetical protein HanHA300_Chr02g0046801 [Helianthus annuus]KAJ0776654.1 hypothetical protein HanLR1_Chr02g0048161 [Helianthus annuus]
MKFVSHHQFRYGGPPPPSLAEAEELRAATPSVSPNWIADIGLEVAVMHIESFERSGEAVSMGAGQETSGCDIDAGACRCFGFKTDQGSMGSFRTAT